VRTSTVCRIAGLLLCSILAMPPRTACAEQAAAPTQLNIVIVEGEGAVNNLRQRVVREPIVRVEDQNHKPVAGAVVVFLLPGDGSGGAFANGSQMLTVTTDDGGQAAARGMRAGNVTGQYQIRVTASVGRVTATATISQTNSAAATAGGAVSGKLIAILAIAGGAAAGIAIALTHGGGSSSATTATTATTLSAGTATVGAPH